jgi:hypothetical protein
VVLGVGLTAGSFILTDTALKSFDDLFGDVYKGTTSSSRRRPRSTDGGSNSGAERAQADPRELLPKVQSGRRRGAADGSIGSTAWIVDPATNKVIQNGGRPRSAAPGTRT